MMKKNLVRILTAALCLLACSVVLAPHVTALPPPLPPVPPSGPCDHWIYPYSGYTYEVVDSERLPIMVKFNSTSSSPNPSFQPLESWRWDFGDGTTSTVIRNEDPAEGINPRHLYSVYQEHFDVCLKVTTVCTASDETCKRIVVHCSEPKAGFTVDKSEGVAPLSVRITDTSQHTPEGITSWEYQKGATVFSREKNTFFTFTDPGDYTIKQTVKKTCNPGSDSYSQTIHVREPIKTYTVMNLSFPTTTPTLAVLGVYFNISNTSAGNAAVTTTTAPGARVTTVTAGVITAPAAGGSGVPAIPLAAPPAGTGTGTLSVTSSPAGATVYIDDTLRGASPVTISNLPAGSHMLRLEREGYQTMTVPVDIPAGRTTEYVTSLVPVPAGDGDLPLIAGGVLVLAMAAAGGYLFMKKRGNP